MLKGWIIYNKHEAVRNEYFIELLMKEASNRKTDLQLITSEEITFGTKSGSLCVFIGSQFIDCPDFVICRNRNPLLSKQFEYMGIRVFNNSFVSTVCNNKMLTYQYLAQAGIPIMDTSFTPYERPSWMEFPLVLKPADGRGGNGVFMAQNAKDYCDYLEANAGKKILVQKVASDIGKDVRVYVIGGKIVASVLRESKVDFRSNYSLGGSAFLYTLQSHERMIIEKIVKLFDFDFVGIDFVVHNGNLVLNEIEDVVGSRMLYAITDINIASQYLDYIVAKF